MISPLSGCGFARRLLGAGLLLVASACRAAEPPLDDYAALLAAHVHAGERHGVRVNLVDYRALAADPRLARAVAAFEDFPPARLANEAETLAFYINAYNLFTLRLVATHLPLAGIRDLGSWLRPVWKQPAGRIGGEQVSLDDIEHGVLRKRGEPRIHFAIVCASVSCPDLRTEPYVAARLEAQLDAQVHGFLGNPGKGLRRERDALRVSRIFDWFAADFAAAGGVTGFLRRYVALPEGDEVAADLDYDWSLNGTSPPE